MVLPYLDAESSKPVEVDEPMEVDEQESETKETEVCSKDAF